MKKAKRVSKKTENSADMKLIIDDEDTLTRVSKSCHLEYLRNKSAINELIAILNALYNLKPKLLPAARKAMYASLQYLELQIDARIVHMNERLSLGYKNEKSTKSKINSRASLSKKLKRAKSRARK